MLLENVSFNCLFKIYWRLSLAAELTLTGTDTQTETTFRQSRIDYNMIRQKKNFPVPRPTLARTPDPRFFFYIWEHTRKDHTKSHTPQTHNHTQTLNQTHKSAEIQVYVCKETTKNIKRFDGNLAAQNYLLLSLLTKLLPTLFFSVKRYSRLRANRVYYLLFRRVVFRSSCKRRSSRYVIPK